jgi:peptidyl-tRNA hydrolase, PTH1 family
MDMDNWLIVGLGNPGEKYEATRHNAGFMLIDRLSDSQGITLKVKDDSAFGKGRVAGHDVVLCKPLTYMNLSGRVVRKILAKSNLIHDGEIHNLIVVHDDLDLPPGVIKIRRGGSSGGHKGIESIINDICSREFIRVKIGIGRDSLVPVEDYVLRRFRPNEKKLVGEALSDAATAVETILAEGIEKAMNKYNRTVRTEEQEQQ